MTVNAIGPNPARTETQLLDDNETLAAFSVTRGDRDETSAAIPAGAIPGSALGGVALHQDVRQLAHSARGLAQSGTGGGAVLYSGKGTAAGAAATVTRPNFEQAMERVVDVFAKAGKLDALSPWLTQDPAKRVRFELKPGTASYYDAARRTMVLGADSTPGEHAQAIVFAQRKEHYEKADRNEPTTKDEYVRQHSQAVANAAGDAVEFTKRARASGVPGTPVTPLEKMYDAAHQQAYTEHMNRQFDELARRTGRYADGVFNPDLAKNYADEHARQVTRWSLAEPVASGKVFSADTQEKYPAVFGREWDSKQTAESTRKAEALARTQAAAQADNEHRARGDAGGKVLIEAMRAAVQEQVDGNKASPHKAQVVELLYAFSVKYPAEMTLLMPEIAPAASQLLGSYGFKTWEQIGAQGDGSWKMEAERLNYAIDNFRRLSEPERMQLEYGVKPASHFGIKLTLTSAELKALESYDVSRRLPDGSPFRGKPADYREQSRRNINNHALAQLKQIRSAGPMSLVGRVFAGEKGAQVGAMFDSMIDVGNARKAQVQVRSGVANPSDVDHRTPIDNGIRRSAPPTAPAGEGRPVAPTSAGASGGGSNGSGQGIAHAPTQPAVAYAATQPAAAGGGNGAPPSSSGSGSTGSGSTGSGSTGSGSTGSGSTAPGTTGSGTAGSGSSSGSARAGQAAGGGLPRSTYYTDPRRVTINTVSRGEQDMTVGEYRKRVEQANAWISKQGPYDLGGPPRHMYERAAEIFTLNRNWQYLGNPLINDW